MRVIWEDHFGDLAIGRPHAASVDHTKHLPSALMALQCQPRVARHPFAGHRLPEALKRRFPIWRQVIEDNVDSEWAPCIWIDEHDVVAFAAQFEPEKISAMLERRVQTQHVGRDGASVREWPIGEDDCAGIDLWGPEDRLRQGAGVWIGSENATPSAARRRRRLRVKSVQWPRAARMNSGIRGCDAGTPRQGRWA
ncbi:hypothetical protein OO17_19085 [Rhodopseudomonas palustris]|uniref:Uncharacterized protein n=1 Tax=Rhodopseudomonas palustris TaxID=1076 RepID=A0A0D7EGW4_RHOPL|nr:hypothetical protein OO17_19085 [Rhodopseudomonas palustris]